MLTTAPEYAFCWVSPGFSASPWPQVWKKGQRSPKTQILVAIWETFSFPTSEAIKSTKWPQHRGNTQIHIEHSRQMAYFGDLHAYAQRVDNWFRWETPSQCWLLPKSPYSSSTISRWKQAQLRYESLNIYQCWLVIKKGLYGILYTSVYYYLVNLSGLLLSHDILWNPLKTRSKTTSSNQNP